MPTRQLPWERITKSRKTIGALLMDQSVIAGVGNVYRSELLFRHHIDPYRLGRDVSEAEFADAWTDLVALMKVGVRTWQDRGGGTRARPRRTVVRAQPATHLRLPAGRRPVPGLRHRES